MKRADLPLYHQIYLMTLVALVGLFGGNWIIATVLFMLWHGVSLSAAACKLVTALVTAFRPRQ